MPKLAQTATVTTSQEIRLAPALRKKLLTAFRTYAALNDQKKVLSAAMDKQKGIIAELREETGEQKLQLEGFTTTLVCPLRNVFDEKLFVSNGGDLAIYNNSFKTVPSKAYEKVSVGKDDE